MNKHLYPDFNTTHVSEKTLELLVNSYLHVPTNNRDGKSHAPQFVNVHVDGVKRSLCPIFTIGYNQACDDSGNLLFINDTGNVESHKRSHIIIGACKNTAEIQHFFIPAKPIQIPNMVETCLAEIADRWGLDPVKGKYISTSASRLAGYRYFELGGLAFVTDNSICLDDFNNSYSLDGRGDTSVHVVNLTDNKIYLYKRKPTDRFFWKAGEVGVEVVDSNILRFSIENNSELKILSVESQKNALYRSNVISELRTFIADLKVSDNYNDTPENLSDLIAMTFRFINFLSAASAPAGVGNAAFDTKCKSIISSLYASVMGSFKIDIVKLGHQLEVSMLNIVKALDGKDTQDDNYKPADFKVNLALTAN